MEYPLNQFKAQKNPKIPLCEKKFWEQKKFSLWVSEWDGRPPYDVDLQLNFVRPKGDFFIFRRIY